LSHLPKREIPPAEVAQYASAAGFRDQELVIAVAIALAESGAAPVGGSGGNANAHNDRGEDSRGLWQINVSSSANPDLKGMNLYDPATNAKAAMIIKQRQGWMAWSVFRPDRGAKYLLFMPKAGVAVQSMSTRFRTSDNPLNDPLGAGTDVVESSEVLADAGRAIGQGVSLAAKAGTFLMDPQNWLRIVYVGVGVAMIVGGLLIIAKPVVQPAVDVAAKAADIAL
jgi:Lysozyme like domain